MRVDRYKSNREPNLYFLVPYNGRIPPSAEPSAGDLSPVGASETRTYPDALRLEIEDAIRSGGYWRGELPER